LGKTGKYCTTTAPAMRITNNSREDLQTWHNTMSSSENKSSTGDKAKPEKGILVRNLRIKKLVPFRSTSLGNGQVCELQRPVSKLSL
jgi:hypothetical protein